MDSSDTKYKNVSCLILDDAQNFESVDKQMLPDKPEPMLQASSGARSRLKTAFTRIKRVFKKSKKPKQSSNKRRYVKKGDVDEKKCLRTQTVPHDSLLSIEFFSIVMIMLLTKSFLCSEC